ncbi:MAG: helical backbone metal receptor [Salinimicrobium sp.]
MMIFFDQLNRRLELKKTPQRIVSLVPSQTELLVDLGLEDRIVGVTKFCVHPRDLRKKKELVGGTKQVDPEKIAKLAPDIILCNKEENTPEMVEELQQIAPVHVSDIKTIDDSLELIREYGMIFGAKEKASEIVGKILDEKTAFLEFIAERPQKKAAYFIWKNPWMVVAEDTFIDHLLALNNFSNVFAGSKSRYPEVRPEELQKLEPDLVLLSTEPFPFKEDDKEELRKLVRKDCIRIVDGEYFSWYGSRLIEAFEYFRKLHAELAAS